MNPAGLELNHVGKVRDTYNHLDVADLLLIVATDRISAFDVVMSDGVLDKGRVLSAMSSFWFERFSGQVKSQSYPKDEIRLEIESQADYPSAWVGRTSFVRRAEMFPVECVVRGYLAGSGLKDYQETKKLFGIEQPPGLRLGSRLSEPVFTPTSKAESGHDEPLSMDEVYGLVGHEVGDELERLSKELFLKAEAACFGAGIVLADTKFEFGIIDGEIALCDEVLTPDSSRFWEASSVALWNPVQFDKQILRDWLEETGWNKMPPPPQLPVSVLASLTVVYSDIYERLTGLALDDWPGEHSSSAYLGERDMSF